MPESIELDIEDLELNATKSIGDLNIGGKDVEIISDKNLNIVSITPPASDEEDEEETETNEAEEKEDKDNSKEANENEDNSAG